MGHRRAGVFGNRFCVYWVLLAEGALFIVPLITPTPDRLIGFCSFVAFIFLFPTIIIAAAKHKGQYQG